MATTAADTLEIQTRQLALLTALASAAEDLSERSKGDELTAAERAALRNQSKLANEQAGTLLTRGTVELFNTPPNDAATQINDAIAGVQATLDKIKKIKQAVEFVGAMVGVASALLVGDWRAVAKSVEALAKKVKAAQAG
jgi:hypothetical protein